MRVSLSPNKDNVSLPKPPLISACIVCHYTNDEYHKERMGIVKLCLDTMLAGMASYDYELLIWDNGSTPEFREFLESYNAQTLILSENVGVHNAQWMLAKLARGKILCFTDDDIIYHPDWFSQQLGILTTYPNVGKVSGSPQRSAFAWGVSSNLKFAENKEVVTVRGNIMPEIYHDDYAISVGRYPREYKLANAQKDDILLEYKGVKAFAHAHHMQFIGYKEIVEPYFFKSDLYLADGRKIDRDIDTAGYLSLSTYRRTALHIGNVIDPSVKEIYKRWYGKELDG